jgi:hypothetical protein
MCRQEAKTEAFGLGEVVLFVKRDANNSGSFIFGNMMENFQGDIKQCVSNDLLTAPSKHAGE